MGIRPVTADYPTFIAYPVIYGFDMNFSKARVPMPQGLLSSQWTIMGEKIIITVDVPAVISEYIRFGGERAK